MNKPSVEDLSEGYYDENDDLELVWDDADPSWRHGCYMTSVFKRKSDNTYWSVSWRRSGDGEYNSLREGDIDETYISEVEPYSVTIIEYRHKGS